MFWLKMRHIQAFKSSLLIVGLSFSVVANSTNIGFDEIAKDAPLINPNKGDYAPHDPLLQEFSKPVQHNRCPLGFCTSPSKAKDSVAELQNFNVAINGAAALAGSHKIKLQGFRSSDAVVKPLVKACTKFIKEDGGYGVWGKEVNKQMNREEFKEAYLKDKSLKAYCPNFPVLSDQEKLHAWTWFWMVLANQESTCDANEYHPTHVKIKGKRKRINNKEGWGLFAGELHGGDRDWRGENCEGNMKDVKVQVSCAVSTMFDQQLNKGRGARTMSSYWGPIQRNEVLANMTLFKACFEKGRYAKK